jgi:hypothetical protein
MIVHEGWYSFLNLLEYKSQIFKESVRDKRTSYEIITLGCSTMTEHFPELSHTERERETEGVATYERNFLLVSSLVNANLCFLLLNFRWNPDFAFHLHDYVLFFTEKR